MGVHARLTRPPWYNAGIHLIHGGLPMDVPEIERRLQHIEAELAAVRRLLASKRPKNPRWYRDNAGVFAGDPAAAEAARLGRQYRDTINRDSLKPKRKKPRKAG
jgi:hypothetical protein